MLSGSTKLQGRAQRTLKDWKAIPTHSPRALKEGPPELPELMAASICSTALLQVTCRPVRTVQLGCSHKRPTTWCQPQVCCSKQLCQTMHAC